MYKRLITVRGSRRLTDWGFVLCLAIVLPAAVVCVAGQPVAMELNLWAGTSRLVTSIDTTPFHTLTAGLNAPEVKRSLEKIFPAPPATLIHTKKPRFRTRVLATGLAAPDGIALHPQTGCIVITEKNSGSVRMLVKGHWQTVVDAHTPLFRVAERGQVRGAPLRCPEGICFGPDGSLYVAEDIPGGRLFRFSLNSDGKAVHGLEIDIPGSWESFAWEDIAVAPGGELLLVGSSIECFADDDIPTVFYGVALWKDTDGNWWTLIREPFTAFSAVALSRDGTRAALACELTGDIRWIDLSEKTLRLGEHLHPVKGPEGLALLPDGRLVAAQESGEIVLIDPVSGSHDIVAIVAHQIESLLWDEQFGQLLVTEDLNGRLLALQPEQPLPHTGRRLERACVQPAQTPVHIPETPPAFLSEVLELGGWDSALKRNPEISFSVFARRMPLISLDAHLVPVDMLCTEDDPIVHIQFVVFEPNSIAFSEKGLSHSLTVFLAERKSGEVIHTTMKSVSASGMDGRNASLTDFGAVEIAIPFPAGIDVSPDGVCNVHLMGLGEQPDFHIVMNPADPESSYVLMEDTSGAQHQYKLAGTSPGDMVVSWSRNLAQSWTFLGHSNSEHASPCAIQTAQVQMSPR